MKGSHTLVAVPAILLIAGCTVLTPPSEDPVLIKLEELDRRLQAIERVVQNQSLVSMTQQLSALERRVDELQGNAEEIEYNASTSYERQRELYSDLDARIQELESSLQTTGAVSVMEGGTLPPGQLPVPGGSDRDNYQAAFELLKEQRYEPAALAFQQFLVSYPDSELADNAQYWLAESYYVTQQFEQALSSFQTVIDQYPRSRKVPDALLKMGYCNYELERWDAARAALSKVQSDYPETTAARLAGQRLERMGTEGV
ncbi:MAG: tol-pal system protein YbgF [Gammaproteobacteria bacterium]|nr:tol-pal system protein YbgF [Gammaproteobacteria bacterium]